jgi:hypothetical protein
MFDKMSLFFVLKIDFQRQKMVEFCQLQKWNVQLQ